MDPDTLGSVLLKKSSIRCRDSCKKCSRSVEHQSVWFLRLTHYAHGCFLQQHIVLLIQEAIVDRLYDETGGDHWSIGTFSPLVCNLPSNYYKCLHRFLVYVIAFENRRLQGAVLFANMKYQPFSAVRYSVQFSVFLHRSAAKVHTKFILLTIVIIVGVVKSTIARFSISSQVS